MLVESVGGLVLTFVLVVLASYVGAKMALRSFFGREFLDPETGEFVLPPTDGDDEADDTNR